ncbi:2'-5' RNA ligase family protein [Arthrobacter sp. Br18]|uniref:2'-5' RNA ligase family protein n=1 Tax=Arthrobacter sp. Br18 TaxID=1312954 RepID=UPI00047BB5DB|nr:2'-5' RNA ligase family protein [Arthrobacter sp. Br18]
MTDSVELLLDPVAQNAVLEDWKALEDTGLPNSSRHASWSNSPHITLAAAARIDAEHDAGLAAAAQALPIALATAGLLVFPTRNKFVLARQVVCSPAMMELHRRIWAVLAVAHPVPTTMAGQWTPHLTLARGLTAEELARAAAAISRRELPPLHAVAARRWDSVGKAVVLLAPRADPA